MAPTLTAGLVALCFRTGQFAELDTDGSGTLSRRELRRGLLHRNGLSAAQIDALFDAIDGDGSGVAVGLGHAVALHDRPPTSCQIH